MLTMLDVAKAVQGSHLGGNPVLNAVSTDSRTIADGALFVALRGTRFDGHEYVDEALGKGAHGVLVDVPVDAAIAQIVVNDTEAALGQLAAAWRARFDIPVVAVTGSNGKTTVKEMIGRILSANADTLVSHGNFNNPVGLPLSLLKIRQHHHFTVVEIGMNQVGEIEQLAAIARPTVAVITNAGAAHLENLVSVSQVAEEKGKILSALGANGIAVLNRDSEYFAKWRAMAGSLKVITFGLSSQADVSGSYEPLEFGSRLNVNSPDGRFELNLQLAAEHNVVNALAAIAVGVALELELASIKSGLESMTAVAGRLQLRQHQAGGRLIDDTYNANPNSVAAALEFLSNLSGDRRLVIGDMLELGAKVECFHRDIGRQARASGIGRLYALGELSEHAVREFGRGAQHYPDRDALVNDLLSDLNPTTTLLIKGSRGMRMNEIADVLCDQDQLATGTAPC